MPEHDGVIKELLDFLDKNAFDPIIQKTEEDFESDEQKRTFSHVKRSTQNEKERFHARYQTAEEIKRNYLSDFSSSAAKRIDPQIESLGLPTLPQFREQFLKLCDQLGVK